MSEARRNDFLKNFISKILPRYNRRIPLEIVMSISLCDLSIRTAVNRREGIRKFSEESDQFSSLFIVGPYPFRTVVSAPVRSSSRVRTVASVSHPPARTVLPAPLQSGRTRSPVSASVRSHPFISAPVSKIAPLQTKSASVFHPPASLQFPGPAQFQTKPKTVKQWPSKKNGHFRPVPGPGRFGRTDGDGGARARLWW